MPRINLLPWRQQERELRQREFVGHLGLTLIIAAAAVMYGNFTVNGMVEYQNDRNNYLKEQIKIVDGKIEEISALQATKQRLLARMEVIEQLQQSRPEIVHLFDELVRTLPNGVYLNSVTQNGKNLTLRGSAESSARVSTYMRNIDDSVWLATPVLEVIETKEDERSRHFEFSLHTQQTSPQDEAEKAAALAGNTP